MSKNCQKLDIFKKNLTKIVIFFNGNFDQVGANGEVDEVNRRHVLPVGAPRTNSFR